MLELTGIEQAHVVLQLCFQKEINLDIIEQKAADHALEAHRFDLIIVVDRHAASNV